MPDRTAKEQWYQRRGLALPTSEPHGTPEDIRANLQPAKATSWRLEGNRLIAETDLGQLVQTIPPNYLCHGIDDKGLPILQKIVV